VCDTLCAIGPDGALFGKNSDRPSAEVQLIEAYPGRPGGGRLRATHIDIEDAGAFALVGSRPEWGWGFEHGVNEHRVAIGNEKIYTVLDPNKEPPALTGMDLVRLGLERGRTADEALEVMTSLLERYGQGGVCDQTTGESYFSSFLICDPANAWVLETNGRSWAAKRVEGSAAISNRITIGTDWTRASADVSPGEDWDERRHHRAPTAHADVRLAASNACLASGVRSPADIARHLRDHGGPQDIPADFDPISGRGITVCMHLRKFQNTTSSMIAELPADPGRPLRAWLAPGQPCVGVYVPVFSPQAVPAALAEPVTWHAFEALRDWAEADDTALSHIRGAFDPLETELWAEADSVAERPEKQAAFVDGAWQRVWEAAQALASRVETPSP
jgi:secernin